MLKKTFALILTLLLVIGMTAISLAAGNVLRVGSDVTYPPFEFVDERTGAYIGFDMDLIKAIGQAMGKEKVEIINTAWEGIIPGLMNGNYDVLISAMTITEERSQSINFSDSYFNAGQVMLVRKENDSIKVPADLAGKIATAQIGTTGHFVAEKIEGIKRVDKFDTTPLAVQAVVNGSADAAVIDLPVAVDYVKTNPNDVKIAGSTFTEEYYGIGVKKSNVELLEQVNKALAQVKADGTYDEIYDKWFGVE